MCVYVLICACIGTCMWICEWIYIWMYEHVNVYVYVYAYGYEWVLICICISICCMCTLTICILICVCICMHILCMYVYIYIRLHPHNVSMNVLVVGDAIISTRSRTQRQLEPRNLETIRDRVKHQGRGFKAELLRRSAGSDPLNRVSKPLSESHLTQRKIYVCIFWS